MSTLPPPGVSASPARKLRQHLSSPEGKFRLSSEIVLEGWKPVPRHPDSGTRVSVITYAPPTSRPSGRAGPDFGINVAVSGSPLKRGPGGVPDDAQSIAVLANVGDSLFLVDYQTPSPPPLEHAVFARPVTAHEFDHSHPDPSVAVAALGFSSGDVIVHDPLRMSFSWGANKGGKIDPTACRRLMWVPDAPGVLLSLHDSGCAYLWDTARTEDAPLPAAPEFAADPAEVAQPAPGRRAPRGDAARGFGLARQKSSRFNPVERWALAALAGLTDAAFSRSKRTVAISGKDGRVRIVDHNGGRLVAVVQSYYGAVLTVAWAPGGDILACGGEDDMISLFDMRTRRLFARCVGHKSYVSAIAFDGWHCGPGVVRFASAGVDCRVALWEAELPVMSEEGSSAVYEETERSSPLVSPFSPLRQTPVLSPVSIDVAHRDIATSLLFLEDSLITVSAEGSIKIWDRPEPGATAAADAAAAAGARGDPLKTPVKTPVKTPARSTPKRGPSSLSRNRDRAGSDSDLDADLSSSDDNDDNDGIALDVNARGFDGAGVITPGKTPKALKHVTRERREEFASAAGGWSSSEEE